VSYGGKIYEGRHEPLVDEATFEQVQELLSAKRISGERPWRHFHYLRGSIYCGECGRRLIYSRANGKGGLYEYFVCGGRQHGNCTQRAHRVQAVEAAVVQHYAAKELSDQERDKLRSAVTAHIETISTLAAGKVAEAESILTRLERQERKLLQAHYADNISEALFAEEQARIRRERVAAEKRVDGLGVEHGQVLKALDLALAMTDDIRVAYAQAGPQERRLLNQGLFERLEIDSEQVVGGQDTEVFGQLQHLAQGWDQTIYVPALKAKTPDPLAKVWGLNIESLVPLRGFEPRFPD